MIYTIYKSVYKKAMTTAAKRCYNTALKIQNMSFINMPLVFERSLLVLCFWDTLFCVILVFQIFDKARKCVSDGLLSLRLQSHK